MAPVDPSRPHVSDQDAHDPDRHDPDAADPDASDPIAPDRIAPDPGEPRPPGKRRGAPATPAQRALALLVRREHSRKELSRKLAARGIGAEEAEAAVQRMTDAGWQDDGRFADLLVRSRAGAGQGPVRIRAELSTHGLDREAVAAAMDAFDGDWAVNARNLVRRRFPGLSDDPAIRRRAADWLMRRGFTGDQVRAATRHDADED